MIIKMRGPRARRLHLADFGAVTPGDIPADAKMFARDGETAYMTYPLTVFYGGRGQCPTKNPLTGQCTSPTPSRGVAMALPAGGVACTSGTFGWASLYKNPGCYAQLPPSAPPPGNATDAAFEGQGFQVPAEGASVYFGRDNDYWTVRHIPAQSAALTFSCDRQNFGPIDLSNTQLDAQHIQRKCKLVANPAVTSGAPVTRSLELENQYESMQRAQSAAQAARDVAAAQAILAQTQVDAAAQQAQIARDAQAQAAAALAAAEAYRQIQVAAKDQATANAAALAALAAQVAGTLEAKRAAAEMAAQAEAIKQATAAAQADVQQAQVAYETAETAAIRETANQAAAEARLRAAQQAAAAYTTEQLGVGAGMSQKTKILLLAGAAAAAALLLMDQ